MRCLLTEIFESIQFSPIPLLLSWQICLEIMYARLIFIWLENNSNHPFPHENTLALARNSSLFKSFVSWLFHPILFVYIDIGLGFFYKEGKLSIAFEFKPVSWLSFFQYLFVDFSFKVSRWLTTLPYFQILLFLG